MQIKSQKLEQPWMATASLAAAVLTLTISPLFVRWADAPGIVTSLYRMLIAAIALTPFALREIRLVKLPDKKAFLFPILAGFFSAIDHGLWATAIENTTVANATLLNNVSPVWVALFAMVVLKEHLPWQFWIGLIAVLIGASAVLGSTLLFRPDFVSGDYLAIISSFFYAAFFLSTQRGRSVLNTVTFLWVMLQSAAFFLLIFVLILGVPFWGFTVETYLLFLLAGFVAQLGGYFLVTYALGRLPASVVTPTMVAQPVLTALIAIPLMNEGLLLWQVIGGAVTLMGIWTINVVKRDNTN